MNIGDVVTVRDCSWTLLSQAGGPFVRTGDIRGRRWRVLALNCVLPADKPAYAHDVTNDLLCVEVGHDDHILLIAVAHVSVIQPVSVRRYCSVCGQSL